MVCEQSPPASYGSLLYFTKTIPIIRTTVKNTRDKAMETGFSYIKLEPAYAAKAAPMDIRTTIAYFCHLLRFIYSKGKK
jgi:hypothetical protein